jgi:hypothetical protein
MSDVEDRQQEIRLKRTATLFAAWELMQRQYRDLQGTAFLHPSLVAAVVETYLLDRDSLVYRHNIHGRIQRHKIAGLMAAAIVKVRPVQLTEATGKAARVSRDNETLAVLHGIGVCAEGASTDAIALTKLPMFGTWYSDFIYQLRRRHDCGAWCSLVFETLSLAYFPQNLVRRSQEGTQ